MYWEFAKTLNYDLEKLSKFSIEEFDKVTSLMAMERDYSIARAEAEEAWNNKK